MYAFTRQCILTFSGECVPAATSEKEHLTKNQKNSKEDKGRRQGSVAEGGRLLHEDCAILALLLTALSEPLLVLSTHTLVNSLLSPLAWLAMAGLCHALRQPTEQVMSQQNNKRWITALGSGLTLGLLVYIRVDMLLFIFILFFFLHAPFVHLVRQAKVTFCLAASAFAGGFLFGGWIDFLTYGEWFISPLQWFRFNVQKDYATAIFGEYPSTEYIQRIFINDPIVIILTLIAIVTFVKPSQSGSTLLFFAQARRCAFRLLVAAVTLFLIYSSKGHKELRFLHDWIVLFLITNAIGIFCFVLSVASSRTNRRLLLVAVLVVFATSSYIRFPRAYNGSNRVWAWQRSRYAADVNQCLDWLGRQQGKHQPMGVFIDHNIYGVAGHSVIHQPNVDIIGLLNSEFREWDQAAKRRYGLPLTAGSEYTSVSTFHDCSFMCTIECVPRLVKHLLLTPRYNYLVMPAEREFKQAGYDKVKTCGGMSVLRRTTDKKQNQALIDLGQRSSLGQNAALLEREGELLLSTGKLEQGMDVLQAALDLDKSLKKAQQLMEIAKNMKFRLSRDKNMQ